jgi:hypothetical protein
MPSSLSPTRFKVKPDPDDSENATAPLVAAAVPEVSKLDPLEDPAIRCVVHVAEYFPSSPTWATIPPWICPVSPAPTCVNDPRQVPFRATVSGRGSPEGARAALW